MSSVNHPHFPGGILKAHRRQHTCYLFFQWKGEPLNADLQVHRKAWLAGLVNTFSFSREQAKATENWKNNLPIPVFVTCGLTERGLKSLGLAQEYNRIFEGSAEVNSDRRFVYDYNHTNEHVWMNGYLMFAHAEKGQVEAEKQKVLSAFPAGIDLLEEYREVWCNEKQKYFPGGIRPVGPLGFAEGMSNPRGEEAYNVAAIPDPWLAAKGIDQFGSTQLIAQLELDTNGYRRFVNRLVGKLRDKYPELKLVRLKELRENVKSLLMGRFPDGTPRLSQYLNIEKIYDHHDLSDDWYWDDPATIDPPDKYCPFFAHVRLLRKPKQGAVSDQRIVRRGLPYLDDEFDRKGLIFSSFHRSFDQVKRMLAEIVRSHDSIAYRKNTTGHIHDLKFEMRGHLYSVSFEHKQLWHMRRKGQLLCYVPPRSFYEQLLNDGS